ncbi:hypothetical protein EKN06_04425 [Croceicoccus ponticola]|uniref:Leucine-rich repeat domain-containing protein n=1 Tax=Croceicoccus ponticola TaxID=2217664 RepID=A0A437H194_9SPHN|nr:hypothetical protein [Croceicoccus ponticola]RVQ69427.1 hypothetical protein EKN06_04425 [Croceicoccus ponticola]
MGDPDDLVGIGLDATSGTHRREKKSHVGIATRIRLRSLCASAVDQAFFDEIVQLANLEELTMEWPITATDISGIVALKKLRKLRLDSPRNVTDFAPLTRLPKLVELDIENAKHLFDLTWLRPLRDRLDVLGIDGSINTAQKVKSLEPLDGFAFRKLTLTNVRLEDKDLGPLITCRNLVDFHCARFLAQKEDFLRLADARPDLKCQWFNLDLWERRI